MGQAWADFRDSLKASGMAIIGEACPTDSGDRVDGYLHLAALTRQALRGDVVRRLTGNVSTLFDFSVSVHEGSVVLNAAESRSLL
jgi:hypothetical protein